MRLSTSLALAALGLAASALPAAAGTLLVPQQFSTIQKALNAAKPYDTVLVSPKAGGAAYAEAVTISTPHVVLQGKANPVIDGSTLGTVVHFLPDYPQFDYTVFPHGIDVHADHVAVRGMTVQGFASSPQAETSAGINVGAFVPTGPFTGNEVSYSDIEISGDTLQNNSVGLAIQGYTGSAYGATTYLKGYRVLGNVMSGNNEGGAVLSGASILVSGNKFIGNKSSNGSGLDVIGTGLTVSGNESSGNGSRGMKITEDGYTYNPAVNNPKNPNPDPAVTTFNYIHDNGIFGIEATGTQTISGNVIANNASDGIVLNTADYSAVLGNAITNNGGGISVEYSGASISDSGLKISLNQISGNAGDGIYLFEVSGGVISLNNVTGNQGVGIHLSDYTSDYGYNDYAPTTVTQNRALHNTVFDAKDDASAPDGDGAPLHNVWTKNVFGTTDPVGLGK